MKRIDEIIEVTARIGESLLKYGAEISRVEETMTRTANAYKVERLEIFVIANGIFISIGLDGESAAQRIRHIPEISVNLSKIARVNQLSRRIEQENLPVNEALEELEVINALPGFSNALKIAASGLGAGSFCIIFGGVWQDSIGAFINGILIYLFVVLIEDRRFSKVLWHLAGGVLVTWTAVLMYRQGMVLQLDKTIIGSIIPLIPGVAFVNGVRDFADGDYLSGGIRLVDAIIKTVCIAVGVGIVLGLCHLT